MNKANKITLSRIFIAFIIIILSCLTLLPGTTNDYHSGWCETIRIHLSSGTYFDFGFTWLDIVIFVLFITTSITDGIDGHIARSQNLVSNFGKFLDPLADKLLVDSTLVILSIRLDWSNHYQVMWIFPVIMIARDLAIDGLRMLASKKNVVLAANIYGKIKTAIQMGLIPILILNGFPFSLLPDGGTINHWLNDRCSYTYIFTNILVAVAAIFAIISLVIYFVKNKILFEGEKNKQ